jgi:hypothetical protein
MSGFIQFANGVRGVIECGEGAPEVPEVECWWRKCCIEAQGSEGFAGSVQTMRLAIGARESFRRRFLTHDPSGPARDFPSS